MASTAQTFAAAVTAALGPRVRITLDPEGFPRVPAKYGDLHSRGQEQGGTWRVYAYTGHARMVAKLRRVPGAYPFQTGDDEAAVWFAAEDARGIRAAGELLRTRTRRSPETSRHLAATAYRSTSQPVPATPSLIIEPTGQEARP